MKKAIWVVFTYILFLQGCGNANESTITEITLGTLSNSAPELSDQTKSNLVFSSAVAFTLNASDVDSANSNYVYTIQTQATDGNIVITDHETSAFEYQPSSVNGINGDSFSVSLSDGFKSSEIATISLNFSDGTAPNISLKPSDGASNVIVNPEFVITSDDPIDINTLSYNDSDGACLGSVQVSDSNFTNCIGIVSAVATNLSRTITINSLSDLSISTTYKFKVTTDVHNLLGDHVVSDVSNSFTTLNDGLLITEIGECYYSNSKCWFEIYNPSSVSVNMSNYSFESGYADGGSATFSSHEFPLPNVTLYPGQYLVVRREDPSDIVSSNDRVVYISDGTKYPFWNENGYIHLLKSGVKEDFVSFGSSYTPGTTPDWTGAFAVALPSIADQYGHSIGRDGANSDTDSPNDWNNYNFSTMGGANDVTCTADTDSDGIPDCSEQPGSTFAGLPLYDWGARVGQKDIFIEIDYMDATNGGAQTADDGITPRKEALQKVVDAFSEQGIAVHFDVGDLYDASTGVDPSDFDLGGGEEVPFVDAMTFSTAPSVYDYKLDYMNYSRMQIFHYLVFANTQSGAEGSSGLAELFGNDLIVSLGEWGLNSDDTANTNQLINFQASTLMHELGHNLGLRHGGNDDTNEKPNYFSIMNYMYQLYGLSEIGNNEGDRYYLGYYSGDTNCYVWPLNKSYTTTDFIMSYSHGDAANLNLTSINETLGLGQIGSDGVDYNCNGVASDETAVAGAGTGVWTDYDDWSNLVLDFQRYSSGNTSGASQYAIAISHDYSQLMPDKVGNDRTPVAKEYSPSPKFFERLRNQMAN